MAGETEFGRCEICKENKPLLRTYYRYPFQCKCHSPQHFEMIRHCSTCIPEEPELTKITIKTKALGETLDREYNKGYARGLKKGYNEGLSVDKSGL